METRKARTSAEAARKVLEIPSTITVKQLAELLRLGGACPGFPGLHLSSPG